MTVQRRRLALGATVLLVVLVPLLLFNLERPAAWCVPALSGDTVIGAWEVTDEAFVTEMLRFDEHGEGHTLSSAPPSPTRERRWSWSLDGQTLHVAGSTFVAGQWHVDRASLVLEGEHTNRFRRLWCLGF